MVLTTKTNPSKFQRLTVSLPSGLREAITRRLAHETSLPESRIVVELVGRGAGKKEHPSPFRTGDFTMTPPLAILAEVFNSFVAPNKGNGPMRTQTHTPT